MGLPVTSGDPSGGETLDRTVSQGSLFASGAIEKVGMVRRIPPPSSPRTDIGFLNGADLNYGPLV